LSKRYKDLRTAYHSPTVEECFNLLTKETPETFYIGMSSFLAVLRLQTFPGRLKTHLSELP